tara:strand:+ start:194 stop:469 length:276 start_codon:yes stop_codon:yes gene_type:complete
MPSYDFECNECSHQFEEFQTIANMDVPLGQPCPSCYKVGYLERIITKVQRGEGALMEMTKGTLVPDTDFVENMQRIKANHPGSDMEIRGEH